MGMLPNITLARSTCWKNAAFNQTAKMGSFKCWYCNKARVLCGLFNLSENLLHSESSTMNDSQTNRLLGYPDDARLLIINADDFGMCHAVNDAVSRTLKHGVVQSTTLMVPCPWALHAMHFLRDNPGIAFGVHLTAISDPVDYAWGPLTARDKVPSL